MFSFRATTLAGLALLATAACSSDPAPEDDAEGALSLDPLPVRTVSGRIQVPDGTGLRILRLSSQSVFAPSASRAKSVPICSTGPGFPSHDEKEKKDLRYAHFNRAKVDGAAFSVEIPENPGRIITATCSYQRTEDTVLDFTALTEDGVRFRFQVPVQFRDDGAAASADVTIADGRATAPVIVGHGDVALNLRFAALPDQPKTLSGSGQYSFAELAQKITSDPIPLGRFPTTVGASDAEIDAAVLTSTLTLDKRSLRIRRDQARVLMSVSEEKPDGVKAFHPFGACSTARWKIEKPTAFTGLFAAGAETDAIVRFSPASSNESTSAHLGLVHRMLGMGIKLFPAANANTKTESQNILVFDEHGPSGNSSPYFFKSADGKPTFFSNWIFGDDPIAHGNVNMFARAVHEPRFVSLTALATMRADGTFEKASAVRAPKFIKLVPIMKRDVPARETAREELDQYGDGDIEIAVHLVDAGEDGNAIVRYDNRVGVITNISKPLVTTYCDQKMQFHHAPQ